MLRASQDVFNEDPSAGENAAYDKRIFEFSLKGLAGLMGREGEGTGNVFQRDI